MVHRPPSAPPSLPGFEYIRLLGTGGFADVFLYQQQLPRRQVAVKVLLGDHVDAATVTAFTTEANVMAQLSSHPSIVSVHQAGIADDGRPYLVMEYCARPNLQVRHRKERFSEAETLRVGIQIAGAVETAHRAGILHRDIKPANILVTEYGRPALTDFGIAATATSELAGMSVPWSPPESFRSPPEGDTSSDVYSLAATLYTLLTNRSPFEIPGASNTEIDIISRVQSMTLPPVGRSDVSSTFESVLVRAMAKRPTDRYAQAIEFARALQRVQITLGMQATPVDVVEDELDLQEEGDDDGRTRFRSVTSIDAQATASTPSTKAVSPAGTTDPIVSGSAADDTRRPTPTAPTTPTTPTTPMGAEASGDRSQDVTLRRPAGPAVPQAAPTPPPVVDTVVRAPHNVIAPVAPPARRAPVGRIVGWSLGAVGVVTAGIITFAVVSAPPGTAEPHQSATAAAPVDRLDAGARQIADLTGIVQGADAVFTWHNPDAQDGDAYLWKQLILGQDVPYAKTTATTVTVPTDGAQKVCVEVTLLPASGDYADPIQACAS